MRFHALLAAGTLAAIMPAAARSAVSTYSFPASYYVTSAGIPAGTVQQGRFDYVGGNGNSASTNLPAFTVYQVNGAALLSSLRTASGVPGGTVSAINSLSLNLPDLATDGGITPAAGSLVFSYAAYATTPLSFGVLPVSTPSYDNTQVGGLSNQFGTTDALGTSTYTPATANTVTDYPLSGATGYSDITNAIDSGSNFYLIVSAGTATTSADFGAWAGLGAFLLPSNLTVNATVTAVPEPASLGILGTSGLLLLGRRRRQRSA